MRRLVLGRLRLNAHAVNRYKNMKNIDDYVEFYQLATTKDHAQLEAGDGFFVATPTSVTGALHTREPAKFIAMLEFAKDEPRGNHYHLEKMEYMSVLRGRLKCEFYLYDDTSVAKECIVEAGTVIKVSPTCVHTFTALDGDVVALEYSPDRFEQKDVFFIN